ncbi:hypothetical protein T190115A13A_300003 [Tenacibaculum sp. 190524A02b]|uniref:Uncharacterized protein n=1 Tax=Tenacibaculum vairaonense TaxID=3137860 RepID=A0ABM9PN57_9FLAO
MKSLLFFDANLLLLLYINVHIMTKREITIISRKVTILIFCMYN